MARRLSRPRQIARDLLVRVGARTAVESPLHLAFLAVGAVPVSTASRTLVVVEEGASITILESHESPNGVAFQANDAVEFVVGTGATVRHVRLNAEGDANTQLQQAEQAINAGAKVILLVNLSSESGATIIDTARDADVKVIDYDRLTAAGSGADAYVSFDNVKVGQTMADTVGPVIDELPGTPNVVMMNGGPTDNNSKLFKQGYNETGDFAVSKKADAGDWKVVADQDVPDWDNQQALTLFEQILVAQDNKVDAVFAANDGIAGAVVSALKSANQDPVPLSGQDATTGGIQNILAGWQTMTVYKPIKAEADAAAAIAIGLLNGEDPKDVEGEWEVQSINNGEADLPYIALEPIAVTKDNIEETVITDGFRTWDEVCTGEYAQYCPEDR